MYSDTVTIFNRKTAADGSVRWHPTVLEGVDLNTDRAAIAARYGYESRDKAALHVPWVRGGDGPMVGGKRWLPPEDWRRQEDPAGAVTFAAGEAFDFFMEGAWDQAGPVRDADFRGGLYASLLRERDGVFAVTSAAMFSVIPHFEITGR